MKSVWVALTLSLGSLALAEVGGPQWDRVRSAVQSGLPQNAIATLDTLHRNALAGERYPEAIRALVQRIALEGEIQGRKPEEKIRRLEAELAGQPSAMLPVLEVVLAHWYWQYFQYNRHRFVQRSRTSASPGDDIETWDLPRIYARIDSLFTQALAAAHALQPVPIQEYDALIDTGAVSDAHRPTLYDFLAAEALAFYSSGEQSGARPEDVFTLVAESPVFGSVADFLAWQLETPDSSSPIWRALRIQQDLLAFHLEDSDPTALLDADLARLRFGWNFAVGPERASRYKAALERFANRHEEHPLSALARAQWASVLLEEGDRIAAWQVADVGAHGHPETPGGNACFNALRNIEAPALGLQTERVWNAPFPVIEARYRNLERLYFRVVRYDYVRWLEKKQYSIDRIAPADYRELVEAEPEREWTVDLPATPDYEYRDRTLQPPRDLLPGLYYLLASDRSDFQSSAIYATGFWVSELALIVRSGGASAVEGFVLEATTGKPVPGATIRLWGRDAQSLDRVQTGEDGRFAFSHSPEACNVQATHGRQEVGTLDLQHTRTRVAVKPREHTLFFTDRSLYRPGQTIHYKGLCLVNDAEQDRYEVLADRRVTVVLRDASQKELERREQRTNDFGSFSGSFTAPTGRLLGHVSVAVVDGPGGGATVRVEEYRRPKYRVVLDSPAEPPRLGSEVRVDGRATAYTGAPVDGAKVQWRVERQTHYPLWWQWRYWWKPQPHAGGQQIAHGTTETTGDGSFEVRFQASPDSTAEAEEEPVFAYLITADVTDPAGETRSTQRTIRVGYAAISATVSVGSWQVRGRDVELTLETLTLDGTPAASAVRLTVHRLREPETVHKSGLPAPLWHLFPERPVADASDRVDGSNPDTWPEDRRVHHREVRIDSSGRAGVSVALPLGAYRASLETRDAYGTRVTAVSPFQVLDPGASKLALHVPDLLRAPKWTLEPGEEFVALWGSGYPAARAFVEIEHRGRVLQQYWTDEGRTQERIRHRVTEDMRGGFTVRVTRVQENRPYLHERRVEVPWSNKELDVRWERFVSKLEPGRKETWTAVVRRRDGERLQAEVVAALYDASLDAIRRHRWPTSLGPFWQEAWRRSATFSNRASALRPQYGAWPRQFKPVYVDYRTFPPEVLGGRGWARRSGHVPVTASRLHGLGRFESEYGNAMSGISFPTGETHFRGGRGGEAQPVPPPAAAEPASSPEFAPMRSSASDLDLVSVRENLQETAFFLPHLATDERGEVRMEFTMPEALTEWRFLGFAHDAKLGSGTLDGTAVTALDLMVQPHPPRTLREGDVLEFTVKVTNHTDSTKQGHVRLRFAHAETEESADTALSNLDPDRAIEVPARESRTYAWRITVPDGLGVLVYRAVAASGSQSDGEEGYLPVLSRGMLVTESLPLPIRGPATREFDFERLRRSGESPSLRHQSLTVRMVSNPAWYAVMALPYLMEYPHDCSEQTFNRLYANALARHVAQSDPKIRSVFERWRGTDALVSPLERNQDLKAVLIEESPWVRQGERESGARRSVGLLFEGARMDQELRLAHEQLAAMQLPEGAWPWFAGGRPNDYITLYVTTGFGRLRHLGIAVDMGPSLLALRHLDSWMHDAHQRALARGNPDDDHLTAMMALYLYGRTFFLEERPLEASHQAAFEFWTSQAKRYWLGLPHRQSQAHVALALARLGDPEVPRAILRSIREHAVQDEELGMFWRDTERSWWWYRAPIETQAVMIEAFDEVLQDAEAVEACKIWLLKQKQTRDWRTTKATADAVYALLLRGASFLRSDALVEVTLGSEEVRRDGVEAGTGFYEQRFLGPEVRPSQGTVVVRKTDPGVAWGAVHWQYLEDVSRITPYAGTPLRLEKSLHVRRTSSRGPALHELSGTLAVGDELVARIVLRADRDMEYVHLKDYRGSGTEPVNALSGYRWRDGLSYYEVTRDAASHFFIDYLPKGTYVFEYSTRVQHRGIYQSGFAQIQCMYAPEFNSHSGSVEIRVE